MHNQLIPKSPNFLLYFFKTSTYLSTTSHLHTSVGTPSFQSNLRSVNPQQQTSLSRQEEIQHISNQNDSFKAYPKDPSLQISHPWIEWVELMELILKKRYFEGGIGHPFGREELGTKETNQIRTALLNFARDRFDILRYLSRKDIKVVVGSGCPSIDRKVVNSGKRLRSHVGVDEGKVCGACSLRGSCERAYVKAREDEGGRTVDVMRILLTYGLDPITGSVENTPCLNRSVKESVRRLLNEMVEFSTRELDPASPKADLSVRNSSVSENSFQQQKGQMHVPMKQGDWICPECKFLNFAKNVKCLRCNTLCEERLRKLAEDQSHLPLKKGDWLCGKCNFLNFAKNTRCLQCKEKPPERKLIPGEWECPSCNYVNFKRNMLCLKCDWKRPKASNYSDIAAQNKAEYERTSQYNGMNFVRNDGDQNTLSSVKQYRRKESGRSWASLEDDNDDDDRYRLRPRNNFEDFPVAEGKSNISESPEARESWKKEMLRKSRQFCSDNEDNSDVDFYHPAKALESSEDEEIAEWFGHKKKIETID